jgi:hypothetical protein
MDILQAILGDAVQDNTPYLWPPEFNPPAQYLDAGRAALDAGQVDMFAVPPNRLARICAAAGVTAGEGQGALGCTIPLGDGRFAVYYNGRLPDLLRQRVQEHELGHVGSWNGTHDGS